MKPLTKISVFLLLAAALFQPSCKRELSCEHCNEKNNQPPVAKAGPDQIITLPKDSVLLNGTASTDPDGNITSFTWTKISGPASFVILHAADSITLVKSLIVGSYLFELKIMDDKGLSAKDTIRVIVDLFPTTNHAPIANAGPDQSIILPANTVTLDGSASTDPDNNITAYAWTKILGPSSFTIANGGTVQTQVINLVQGTYQFELKVTDAGGLYSKDTMQIVLSDTCDPNRPIINAQLIPFGTLSQARSKIAVASAGNKILFAGGQTVTGDASATVDIYDLATQSWSTSQLSSARYDIAAIAAGNKIYLAGGRQSSDTSSATIDIYDAVSNTWSTAQLSQPRSQISKATVGNKILFAGGFKFNNCGFCPSDKIDIYDISTNFWTVATLSVAREGLSATTAGNKVYFAGGHDFALGWGGTGVYDHIDVYDNGNNSWSTSSLIARKAHHGSFTVGNYIYWAGGDTWNNVNDYLTTCTIERRDLSNGTSTVLHLFQPSYYNNYGQPNMQTLLKNGFIILFTGYHEFDIYDPGSTAWFVGLMSQDFDFAGVVSVNNTIYIAGGGVYQYTAPSNQVWKLDF
jgi:hypothetical protein